MQRELFLLIDVWMLFFGYIHRTRKAWLSIAIWHANSQTPPLNALHPSIRHSSRKTTI
jgi:hypothetical protein